MHRLVTAGGFCLIGLAIYVALVVIANLPHSWAGLLYVAALLAIGIGALRAGANLRRKTTRDGNQLPPGGLG